MPRDAGDLFSVPDKIEYRVDAVRVSVGERRRDRAFGVVDRLGRTKALDPGACLASRRGDHGDPGSHSELSGEHAHAAGRAENQERLARPTAGLRQGSLRGHPDGRDGGGEARLQALGHQLQRSMGRPLCDRDAVCEGATANRVAPELAVDEVADSEPAAPAPTASTRPVPSKPSTSGNSVSIIPPNAPWAAFQSIGLIDAASIATKTSPGPCSGSGTSIRRGSSPKFSTAIALMSSLQESLSVASG